jgi:lipoyl synthase
MSDMNGNEDSIDTVIKSQPDIIARNIETVREKYSAAGRKENYEGSLNVLSYIKRKAPDILTKSGIMTGFCETLDEIISALHDLKECGCDIFTAGQYCSPGKNHVPVIAYISPLEFEQIKKTALSIGFSAKAVIIARF